MSDKSLKLPAIILFTLTAGIYSITLFNGFVYDDNFTILENLLIKDWNNLTDLFSKAYYTHSAEQTYRPLVTLTYFIDYSLWQLWPAGYHLTNILLHAVNVLLVYWFFLLLPVDKIIAFIGALMFGVHPVQAEAVNAISYREDLLTVTFIVASFILFIRLSRSSETDRMRWVALYGLSLLLYLFALLSKEMAVTLPLLLLAYQLCFVQKGKGGGQRSFLLLLSGYVVVTLGYLFLYYVALKNPNPYPYIHPGIWVRFLTLPKILVSYLFLIFVPWQLNADYVVKFSESIREVSVLFPLFILMSLGVVVVLNTKKYREEWFGLLWFFGGLAPVMNIIPIGNIMAERYLYLPMTGFCLFLSTWSVYLYRWIDGRYAPQLLKKVTVTIAVLLLLAAAFRSIHRSLDWKDDFTLWSKTAIISPESSKAHYNVGWFYQAMGKTNDAISHYREAIRLAPKSYDAHYNLGVIYLDFDLLSDAAREFRAVMEINPGFKDTKEKLEKIEQMRRLRGEGSSHLSY